MVGRRYCSPGHPTYLGEPAYVLLQGSDRTDVDRMFFTFVGVPPGAPGLMLASRQPGFVPNPAGSNGDLCLGEPIGRFAGRTHSFWFAGQDGVISQRYPMTSPLPGGGPMLPGETWFFQGVPRGGLEQLDGRDPARAAVSEGRRRLAPAAGARRGPSGAGASRRGTRRSALEVAQGEGEEEAEDRVDAGPAAGTLDGLGDHRVHDHGEHRAGGEGGGRRDDEGRHAVKAR